jgi:pimeloyl-ACP methyl ester carboxylesterase
MTQPKLLLLPGALGAQTQFEALRSMLGDTFEVHTLDFEGHGHAPLTHETFEIEYFADNVRVHLDAHAIERIHIFGYSMGGYVAMYLASQSPERIERIFTLATQYIWTPEVAESEVKFLDAEKIAAKVPQFAKTLEQRHSAHGWRNVLRDTTKLLIGLGEKNLLTADVLQNLPHRIRIGVGDRDNMIDLPQCIEVYRLLRHGELEILPSTPHPFEGLSPMRLAHSIRDFFAAQG